MCPLFWFGYQMFLIISNQMTDRTTILMKRRINVVRKTMVEANALDQSCHAYVHMREELR